MLTSPDNAIVLCRRRPRANHLVSRPQHVNNLPHTLSPVELARHRFAEECIVPVINEALAVKPPAYMTILKLDKKIRDFDSQTAFSPQDNLTNPSLNSTLQNYALNGYKEMSANSKTPSAELILTIYYSALLYLHRSAFIAALREHPNDPLKHRFAPSVLAVHK